jgi:hypothetical protein
MFSGLDLHALGHERHFHWRGARILVSAHGHVLGGAEVNLARLTKAQLIDWIGKTALRDDPYLIFFYRGGEPCIACEMKFGLENIDIAYSGAPGVRYLFGATIDAGTIRPILGHFAEYDGGNWLFVKK